MFTNLDPGTDEITNSKSAQKLAVNQIHVSNDPCLRYVSQMDPPFVLIPIAK